MILLNTETSVSIFIEHFLAASLDTQHDRRRIAIFVSYSATNWDVILNENAQQTSLVSSSLCLLMLKRVWDWTAEEHVFTQ